VDVVGRHRGLLLRTAIVSLLTLGSRLLGFVRETLAASIFGDASPVNDAFVTAWRVPNLFRSLLGEGAMSTSLQTALTREDGERGLAAGRRLFWALARVVGALALVLCALVMLAAWLLPDKLPLTDWAWLGADPGPVRELVVRLMPFVIFVCLAAVVGGALQVRGHFASTALAPVLMNVWWIAALFLVMSRFGIDRHSGRALEYARQMSIARELSWCVLLAGLILLAVQLPALRSRGLLGRDAEPLAPGERRLLRGRIWRVLREAAPLALGAAAYQVNVMIDGFMAVGLLTNGGPSVLYYATRVQQLPLSLVSAAAVTAVFPALAALGHERRHGELRKLHDETHLAIAFAALPAVFGLYFRGHGARCGGLAHAGARDPPGGSRGPGGAHALCPGRVPRGRAHLDRRPLAQRAAQPGLRARPGHGRRRPGPLHGDLRLAEPLPAPAGPLPPRRPQHGTRTDIRASRADHGRLGGRRRACAGALGSPRKHLGPNNFPARVHRPRRARLRELLPAPAGRGMAGGRVPDAQESLPRVGWGRQTQLMVSA
jgi:murein biosynthesis integral membrane protein MurJ